MAQPGGAPPGGPLPLLAVCRWALQAACWLNSAHQLRFMALIMAQSAGPLLDGLVPEGYSCTMLNRGLLAGAASLLLYGGALYMLLYQAIPFHQVALRMTTAITDAAGELIVADRYVRNAGIVQLPECGLCSGVVAGKRLYTPN